MPEVLGSAWNERCLRIQPGDLANTSRNGRCPWVRPWLACGHGTTIACWITSKAALNAGALGTARRNARRAGVLADVQLDRVDVAAAVATGTVPGLVVGNLPYGIRVGARDGLEAFDADFGRTLARAFPGWRKGLLVDDEARLARAGGSAPHRVHRLVNGGLPVVLGVWEAER